MTLWRTLNIVHPYQTVLYLGFCGWGIYSLIARERMVAASIMPPTLYHVWLSLHILGPATVWAGQILHARKPTPKRTLLGWELQWAGDAAIFFMVVTTAYAFWESDDPGYPYLIAVFASWAVCAFLLSTRDLIAIGYYFGACHKPGFNPDVLR